MTTTVAIVASLLVYVVFGALYCALASPDTSRLGAAGCILLWPYLLLRGEPGPVGPVGEPGRDAAPVVVPLDEGLRLVGAVGLVSSPSREEVWTDRMGRVWITREGRDPAVLSRACSELVGAAVGLARPVVPMDPDGPIGVVRVELVQDIGGGAR